MNFFNKIRKIAYKIGISYTVPSNINTFFNYGLLGIIFLISQIITGIFLGMHYVANLDLVFKAVEHIMRDVNEGWFLRYLHANGASMFFFVIYVHIFRGIFYNSYYYPRGLVWQIGVVILLLMIITSFLGYVLPWGQMSYWAAVVITNLAAAVPVFGDEIIIFLWGGFSVSNPTLNKFFSLHYILPFFILSAVLIHLAFLHVLISTNPLGILPNVDAVRFGIYFIIKDLFIMFIFFVFCSLFIFFYPNLLSHTDNYIPANPLVTPNHIVPEWYFLPFYAILRSVPNKLMGVILLLASILLLIIIPIILTYEIRTSNISIIRRIAFFLFIIDSLILGWIGSKDIVTPFYEIGQVATIFYFLYFLTYMPCVHSKLLSWVYKKKR